VIAEDFEEFKEFEELEEWWRREALKRI